MSTIRLLTTLSDGEFHSGEDLASALGVSRTAVWKQLKKVTEETGLNIESVRGRGYRIPGGLDLLDGAAVRAALSGRADTLLTRLQVLDTVDSTNAEALRQATAGCASGLVCTAEQQTAGRGRRGRQWISPYAGNLYVSLLWGFTQGAGALEGLSLAVGVAVTRALQACGVPGVQLKWPNDVLCGGAKLGGILLEMTGDASGACQVVIGIGLNVNMPLAAASAIDQAWTDVNAIDPQLNPGRNLLLASLLNELLPLVADFEEQGFAAWRESWQALDAFAGAPVLLSTGASEMAGIARGVDARGALLLETASGVQTLFGGEISLRPAA